MKRGTAIRLMLCAMCLVFCSRFLPVSEAQNRSPYATIIVCIYDFDSASQQVTFDVNATAYQVNLTSRVIIGELDSPYMARPFFMTPQYGLIQGVYEGGASGLQWPMYGRTQDYPFDSYSTNFTFSINSYTYRNGTTGRPIDITSAWVGFCGAKTLSLENRWDLNSTLASIIRGNATSRGVQVQLHDKSSLGGLLMAPIWMAAIFLGASFILDSKRLNSRLTIFLAVFVFAPAYLFTILTVAPSGSILNPLEIQATFLTIAVAISGLVSIATTRIESIGRRAALEGVAIVLLESCFVLFSLMQTLSEFSTAVNVCSLFPFALIGILGIYWRLYTYTPYVRKDRMRPFKNREL